MNAGGNLQIWNTTAKNLGMCRKKLDDQPRQRNPKKCYIFCHSHNVIYALDK